MLEPALPLKRVGDDTLRPKNFQQHFVIERRRLGADMHHHRHLEDFRDLLAELDGRDTPRSR